VYACAKPDNMDVLIKEDHHIEGAFMEEVEPWNPDLRMAKLVLKTAVAKDDALAIRFAGYLKDLVRNMLLEEEARETIERLSEDKFAPLWKKIRHDRMEWVVEYTKRLDSQSTKRSSV
jgi:hypothetical protein